MYDRTSTSSKFISSVESSALVFYPMTVLVALEVFLNSVNDDDDDDGGGGVMQPVYSGASA